VETLHPPPPDTLSGVFVDHVRFAFRESFGVAEQALLSLMCDYWADPELPCAIEGVELLRSDRAGNFAESRSWSFHDQIMCRVLAPGQSTRGVGHIIIDGRSCRLFRPEFWSELSSMGLRRGWTLKRVDLAVDDDSGLLTVDTITEAYHAGQLDHPQGGGRRLLDPRDPRRGTASTGWTVYIGARTSRTFARFYDKWSEVLATRGPEAAALIPRQRVRCELEFKLVKGGIPLHWDMLANHGPYFAADSELCRVRASGVEPIKVGRVARDDLERELWALLRHCRNSYGAAIQQAFWALGADDQAASILIDSLRRPGSKPPVPGVREVAGGQLPDDDYVHGN